ncbi:LysE family translocator [Kocuria palustris]|uniref:LysE family translocator n=1 Tax=Kocuria palustris TaxID=71999 RepID=UPI0021B34F0C|nr:LysE family translocator [Kocuria palustris]
MELWSAVLSFAVVAGLMTITPGLDTALVIRTGARAGRRSAMAATLGIVSGIFLWAVVAAVGISALLLASSTAYTVVKIAGAVYMVWLGAGMILSAVRRRREEPAADTGMIDATAVAEGARCRTGRPIAFYRQGLLANLMNPKIGAFYVALIPQFLPPETPALVGGSVLGLVHVVETLLWFGLIILAVHRMKDFFARPAVQRWTDAVAGTVITALGVRLALAPSD